MINSDFLNTYNEKKPSKKTAIEISKFISKAKKFGDKLSDSCLICGIKPTSFCNSHSLPSFVLRKLSSDGKLLTGHSLITHRDKKPSGINNSLTFTCICEHCDNTFFQEYENEDALKSKITDIAINEIAIKNHLRYLYKQNESLNVYNRLSKENKHKLYAEDYFYRNQQMLCEHNIRDSYEKLERLIKRKSWSNHFIIDEINLDYPTQMAYQGFVSIACGFDGLINNVYDYSLSNRINQLGICVFPYDNGTKILLFCENNAPRMKYFYKHYWKLSLEEKLYVINYLILLYEEDFVIDGNFNIKSLTKDTLLLIHQTDLIGHDPSMYIKGPTESPDVSFNSLIETYGLKTSGNVYNFLAKH